MAFMRGSFAAEGALELSRPSRSLETWGLLLESPETFRAHLGWHNSLCNFKTKASRGTTLCSCFYFYSVYNIPLSLYECLPGYLLNNIETNDKYLFRFLRQTQMVEQSSHTSCRPEFLRDIFAFRCCHGMVTSP